MPRLSCTLSPGLWAAHQPAVGPRNGDSGAEQKERQSVEHYHAVQCRRLIAVEVFIRETPSVDLVLA